MRTVIIESPYAGDVEKNVDYARAAMLDCLNRGESPMASHLLYTQVLDDNVPEYRRLGIDAGHAWARKADGIVFYADLGWSVGMMNARIMYDRAGIPYEVRKIR